MINNLVNYLENKKILILGFGREGYSTYKFIRRHMPNKEIFISDANPLFTDRYPEVLDDANAHIMPNEEYLKSLEDYDVIMKTPGLSLKDVNMEKFEEKIKSQVELFMEFVDVYKIGITGTKGKSTTSSLIYAIVKDQKEDVHLLGNIGTPIFDEIDSLNENSVVVMELSSHQLEFTRVSPDIAIVLNLFEEHLDHYKSYEHYINAKLNICRYQSENNYFLYSIDNECLREHVAKMDEMNAIKSKVFEISYDGNSKQNEAHKLILRKEDVALDEDGNVLYKDSAERQILGNHNFSNIMFAMTVAKIMDLDLERAIQSVYEFKPLAHRMEFVGEIDGVRYYNDSIATIPASTINGIETLGNVNTLIIGGKDRQIDYTEFAEYLNNKANVENLICLPDTGWSIAKMITNESINKYIVADMQEAVKRAKEVTKKGTICLLSPAASSYGFFKNFEERGNLFKQLVKS